MPLSIWRQMPEICLTVAPVCLTNKTNASRIINLGTGNFIIQTFKPRHEPACNGECAAKIHICRKMSQIMTNQAASVPPAARRLNILFCSFFADGLHGSPIHILEYGKYLVSAGHRVSYAAVLIEPPIRELFSEYGIPVHYPDEVPGDQPYDIVWAYHTFLLPYLISHGHKFKKLVASSLSPFHLLERISFYHAYATMLTAVSPEVQRFHRDTLNIELELVPNHIPDDFFAYPIRNFPDSPRKIAVISNHPPQEILDLSHTGIRINYFGSSVNNSVLMTPGIMLDHDRIISIGKSVFYGLGLGIPVYEYDHFGGCGYITGENMDRAADCNFSGRPECRKLSSQQIMDEIISGYANARSQLALVRNLAEKRYKLSSLVNMQLEYVKNKPDFELPDDPQFRLYNDTCCAAIELLRHAHAESSARKEGLALRVRHFLGSIKKKMFTAFSG